MKRMIFAAIAALAVAGCQPSAGTVEPSNSPAPVASAVAAACDMSATAMYAAEAAYNAPAAAYVSADARGVLTAATKAKVKPMLTEAYDWLKKARLFYSARNAVGFCDATASLKSSTDNAKALLPAAN